MKRVIALLCILLIAAGCAYLFIMDPVSLDRNDVAAIEVRKTGAKHSDDWITYEDHVFQITDINHIHYITDCLNNVLPVPCTIEPDQTPITLSLLDAHGSIIATVTIHGNDYLVTDKGAWQADLGELVSNINRIDQGEEIRTSMSAFAILFISWLFVAVVVALAGLILYLIQMTICVKTDSLAYRLLPTGILLIFCLTNYHTQIMTGLFYFTSTLAFNSTSLGIILITAAAALSIILGWRVGDKARREAAS